MAMEPPCRWPTHIPLRMGFAAHGSRWRGCAHTAFPRATSGAPLLVLSSGRRCGPHPCRRSLMLFAQPP
eukprot:9079173-Alexandrium_andersonii.AAC.1